MQLRRRARENPGMELHDMITCCVRYIVDPRQLADFERYARAWMSIVERLGGQHHGYFLPHEGANNVALCLFSFPDLATYEAYRRKAATDAESLAAVAMAEKKQLIVSYERTFMRPLLPEASHPDRSGPELS
jgi:hypothetical protein